MMPSNDPRRPGRATRVAIAAGAQKVQGAVAIATSKRAAWLRNGWAGPAGSGRPPEKEKGGRSKHRT